MRFYKCVSILNPLRSRGGMGAPRASAVGRIWKRRLSQGLPVSTVHGRKRFYKGTGVRECDGNRFEVTLDGRPVKTPRRNQLAVRTKALAQGIANEWDLQDAVIVPATMPLMELACTTIDTTRNRRDAAQLEMLRFLRTDTVLFPGDVQETNPALVKLQQEHWDPLVEWMNGTFGKVHRCTDVTMPPQPESTVDSVKSFLKEVDEWDLTALESLTAGCKSIIIPLALYHGFINVEQAVHAARVEEEHQVNQWGLVEGNHDVDRASLIGQIASCSYFLKCN